MLHVNKGPEKYEVEKVVFIIILFHFSIHIQDCKMIFGWRRCDKSGIEKECFGIIQLFRII